MKKEMLINVLQPEECRIAIIEDGVLEELYVERTSHESYVGNIYKGRIVNIEPSIQAAFVDFGVGRNGFLHVSDVEPAYYRHLEDRGEGGFHRGGRDRHRGGSARSNGPRTDRRGEGRYEPDIAIPGPERQDSPEESFEFGAGIPRDSESAADTETPASAASLTTSELEAENQQRGGRGRRSSRGRSRRGRRDEVPEPESRDAGQSGPSPEVAPSQAEADVTEREGDNPKTSDPNESPKREGPRFMPSAERRTEEEDPSPRPVESSSSQILDADLFFPRSEPETTNENEPEPPPPETEPLHEQRDELAEEAPAADEEAEPFVPESESFEQPFTPEDSYGDDFDEAEIAPRGARLENEGFGNEGYGSRPPRRRGNGRGSRGERGDRGDRRERGGPRGRRGPSGRPGLGRPKPLIQDIFKRGQEVLVQVIKEGVGTKGPTLSTYISIAGRYLVLMPGLNRIGVSRKIIDEEQRRRLRDILSELQPPKGLGFIVRTAGLDKAKKDLQRDLAYLSRLWQVVVRRVRKLKGPNEIYRESDMITRTIRDTFTSEIETVWVDEPAAYDHAQEFCQIVMPRYASRIKLYDGVEPMFHKYGLEKEIARIQQRHVPLPNGGSIVIDQTEALVAIDVNSGNFRADNNAEETAYQMNLHAAKEIARQLRLRDLGGVIVNDFIDMRDEKHRRGVERALRDAVKRDRARTKILRISAFGLIEMTRQRIRPSLKRSVYQDCPHCSGMGQVKTCESMSIDVMRLLQLAAHSPNVSRIDVRVADDVAGYLLNKKRKEISHLEESGTVQVSVTGLVGAPPETLEFLCLDNNNNEVKFLPHEETPARRR